MKNGVMTGSGRRDYATLPLVWLVACLAGAGLLLAQSTAIPKNPEQKVRTKSIEDVKVGDYVLAKDPDELGPPTPHQVTALPRNWTEHVVHVSVAGPDGATGEVQATREHPFYTRNRGWVKAKDLNSGDKLENEMGLPITIASIRIVDCKANTYNLTVDGVHTFYVVGGGNALLVHNAPVPIPPVIYRSGGTNPGNFKPSVDGGVSFRDSISNPLPKQEPLPFRDGINPYSAIPTSQLPPGSVVPDGAPFGDMPPGHVSVYGVDDKTLSDLAKQGKGKLTDFEPACE
jgi:hypothetical protein